MKQEEFCRDDAGIQGNNRLTNASRQGERGKFNYFLKYKYYIGEILTLGSHASCNKYLKKTMDCDYDSC